MRGAESLPRRGEAAAREAASAAAARSFLPSLPVGPDPEGAAAASAAPERSGAVGPVAGAQGRARRELRLSEVGEEVGPGEERRGFGVPAPPVPPRGRSACAAPAPGWEPCCTLSRSGLVGPPPGPPSPPGRGGRARRRAALSRTEIWFPGRAEGPEGPAGLGAADGPSARSALEKDGYFWSAFEVKKQNKIHAIKWWRCRFNTLLGLLA